MLRKRRMMRIGFINVKARATRLAEHRARAILFASVQREPKGVSVGAHEQGFGDRGGDVSFCQRVLRRPLSHKSHRAPPSQHITNITTPRSTSHSRVTRATRVGVSATVGSPRCIEGVAGGAIGPAHALPGFAPQKQQVARKGIAARRSTDPSLPGVSGRPTSRRGLHAIRLRRTPYQTRLRCIEKRVGGY